MKRAAHLLIAALPGLAIAGAALAGAVPTAGDLATYFLPLRQRTAEVLAGARSPYWNPDSGCGEPFLANPQSVLGYPPAWLAAVLPVERAVGVEVGLHLAWLAAGCALLARRLAARAPAAVAAGWAAALAGPMLSAAGVLNNLDAVAWLPWAWVAALAGAPVALAGCLAAAFLAGEPQLAAMGWVVAAVLAPRQRTVAALLLAGALGAAVLVPFAVWVAGGDRGPDNDVAAAAAGAVAPAELGALVAPGIPAQARPDRYVSHLLLPGWVVLLGTWAALRRPGSPRRLALCGLACAAGAVVAGLPLGREAWFTLTQGLVRFPSRLLFVAVPALAVAAAATVDVVRVRVPGAALIAAAWLAGGIALGGAPLGVLAQAVTTAAALLPPAAPAALLLGTVAVAPFNLAALDLRAGWRPPSAACLTTQRAAARLYPVETSRQLLRWAAADSAYRYASVGLGYTCLLDGRRTARSFAPVRARTLVAHLAEADRGPSGRWWLDSLAADALVAPHPVAGFPPLCDHDGVRVVANPAAWPEITVLAELPVPQSPPRYAGEVLSLVRGDDELVVRVRVAAGAAVVTLLSNPDPGWRYLLDGRPAAVVRGAGILHGVAAEHGEHELHARYRPPLFRAGVTLSLLAGLAVVAAGLRAARRRGAATRTSGPAAS